MCIFTWYLFILWHSVLWKKIIIFLFRECLYNPHNNFVLKKSWNYGTDNVFGISWVGGGPVFYVHFIRVNQVISNKNLTWIFLTNYLFWLFLETKRDCYSLMSACMVEWNLISNCPQILPPSTFQIWLFRLCALSSHFNSSLSWMIHV